MLWGGLLPALRLWRGNELPFSKCEGSMFSPRLLWLLDGKIELCLLQRAVNGSCISQFLLGVISLSKYSLSVFSVVCSINTQVGKSSSFRRTS